MIFAFPVAANPEVKTTSTGVVKILPSASVKVTEMPVEPPGAKVLNPTTGVEMVNCGIATAKVTGLLTLRPFTVAEAIIIPVPDMLPAESWILAVPVASVRATPATGLKDPNVVVKLT
jgi:hypothetical protein